MKAPIFVVLAFLVNSALAGIFSSSGLQRKFLRDNCTFQWTVTGTVADFVIYNQTTDASVAQNPRVSLNRDSNGNTISMTITSIALWDAGNYTLSINNGAAWENDSSALLFVFVYGSGSLSLTLGRNPPTEGDSVELTCAYTSNSLPLAYRPGVVYSWSMSWIGTLQVLSNGSLQTLYGDIVSGCSTRNNGRTVTIASVQYNDEYQYMNCYVKEDGSNLSSSNYFYLNVQYRPVVLSTNPPSRKFNALVGERVQLSVNQRAYPRLQAPVNNWTFVSSGVNVLDVPEGSVVGTYSSPSLSFLLQSVEYYGKYFYNMSNAIGTTMVTFEVLPPGPPDTPAAFRVLYATHFSIALQWICMWSNFNNRPQNVYTLLKEAKSNIIVENSTTSLVDCYNSTGECVYDYYYYIKSTIGQVNMNIAALPKGTEYVFDFTLYVGNGVPIGRLNGIRVSTEREPTTPDVPTSDLVPAVIALAIVLGIAVLAIIGMLIGIFIWKRRHYISTSNPARPNPSTETKQSETDDYQELDRQTSENHVYANLEHSEGI